MPPSSAGTPSPDPAALARARDILTRSRRMVFFGGAGLSTESGIPDFRSADGIYLKAFRYPPESVLSLSFFNARPEAFYEFYRERVLEPLLEARPNPAHETLARWEAEGRLQAVITQNIDGLHQRAGSRSVLELHGTAYRNYCLSCGRQHGARELLSGTGAVRCGCGGLVRPDVVLFEEGLDQELLARAARHIREAEVLIVAGTSLSVWPAAGLLRHFRGHPLVLINLGASGMDGEADILIRGRVGEILGGMADPS